ncbi:MAG TPA: STAS domain-containing protein [Pyrinomonadaceae bacterium]|jgi:anti-sigma B factor antagonist
MFTRRVIMNIKPGSGAEVGRIFRDEVIPSLRGQKGMRHDDAFISPQLSEAVLNSYWDSRECAESYDRAAYPAALSALSGVLEGTPEVETFNISSATFHQFTAPRRAAHRASTFGQGVWTHAPLTTQPTHTQERAAIESCKIEERRMGAVTVLDLIGELRAGESQVALREAIGRLSGEGRNQILLNLAGLSAVDAGGLGELLQSGVELNKGGGQLKLLHPARALREMMSITKLSSVFDMFESESEAVAAFADPLLDTEGQLVSYEHARYETRS